MHNSCTYPCACIVYALTYEARGGRIGLDILLSVALYHIPESPHIARVKDVEGLAGMELAVLRVRTKQVVVRTGIPLMKKEIDKHLSYRKVESCSENNIITLLHFGE